MRCSTGRRPTWRNGPILELGLGNGRSYDHLRDRLPGREIYVFERAPAAHPDSIPPDGYLIVGDIFETLPEFRRRFGSGCAALVHADLGTGDEADNRRLAAQLGPVAAPLLCPGGLLLGDRAFPMEGCAEISAAAGAAAGRYFVYRRLADVAPCRAGTGANARCQRGIPGAAGTRGQGWNARRGTRLAAGRR